MKLWIIIHHLCNNRGQAVWPIFKDAEPTTEEALAVCENPLENEIPSIEVRGPWEPHQIMRYQEPKQEEPESDLWFVNRYKCDRCNHKWEDQADCTCNDRCPICRAEIEPYESEDACSECGEVLVPQMADEEVKACPVNDCPSN